MICFFNGQDSQHIQPLLFNAAPQVGLNEIQFGKGSLCYYLVLLFRLALSDAQTIQQGIFIDKQFYCIPKNKSNNGIFYTGD